MELPLFPLNTVLFPGETLPIHIFEERYKLMVRHCLERQGPFGVVLIRSGREVGEPAEPFEVGTTARITQVEQLEEDRLNIITMGGQRFRIATILQQRPYLLGQVELLSDVEDESNTDLTDTVGALFAEYYRLLLALSNQWTRSLRLPSDATPLSDFVAARLAVSPAQKQRLLETLSVRQRLKAEEEILGEAIRQLTIQVAMARSQRWQGFTGTN